MNGTSSLKTTSSVSRTDWTLTWIEALLLIGGGVMAVVLHRTTDLSLGLPGHHGIEWMAIMMPALNPVEQRLVGGARVR